MKFFSHYFMKGLVTDNCVLIIPEYRSDLILVTQYSLSFASYIESDIKMIFISLCCFSYACEEPIYGTAKHFRAGCIEAMQQSWCARIMRFNDTWTHIIRDFDDSMRLVHACAIENVLKNTANIYMFYFARFIETNSINIKLLFILKKLHICIYVFKYGNT